MTGKLWKSLVRWWWAAWACAALPVWAGEPWLVKEAPIRFTVSLERSPTHPSAGYFLHLPDGGMLPGPAPNPQVFDQSGNALKSCVLWQNPESGLAVVFEAPQNGNRVAIYVTQGMKLNVWTPESGLTPSAIICTYPGHPSKAGADALARLGPVAASVHYRNESGSQGATVTLPGDRSGRPGLAAMYMLAYVATKDPGNTWIAPITFGGALQVSVDGRPISPRRISDKQGGVGAHVDLSAGLHRLELLGFYAARDSRPEMLLTWRTPKTPVNELGGLRPSDLRYAGTPMWETRQLHNDEVVRSGACAIQSIQAREGGPVANFTLAPKHIYWFDNESPLLLYTLHAGTAGNPAGTQYTWSFSSDPGALATGTNIAWLFAGERDQRVTLKVTDGTKASQCTLPFYPFTTSRSSLNEPAVRADFRNACLALFRAYPLNKDPTAAWDASWWNNFFRTMELTPDNELLVYMVDQRWDLFGKKLPLDKKELLEDMFLASTSFTDPPRALKWALQLEQKVQLRSRAIALRLKGAEVLMYELKNLPEARKWIKPLAAETGEGGAWAKIRMGDIEFLSRNLNEATQLYGDVQNLSKHSKLGPQGEGFKPLHLKGSSMARTEEQAAPPVSANHAVPPPGIAPWKLGAIRDVAASESVETLIEQGFYWEAYQALRAWEREFPLSKISSDYLLLEGKLCLQLGDVSRCRTLLEAYCEQVDASNYLGEALQMIVRCMRAMNEPNEAVAKFQETIRKRMALQ
ncbi:MAG: hypothetical protein NTV49_11980 [Kiritimatiellaeota bacterium]|nr:hypothetical protein [Kiritimatiellota bacterium]